MDESGSGEKPSDDFQYRARPDDFEQHVGVYAAWKISYLPLDLAR